MAARDRGMPLNDEIIVARINLRVAELRVLAAKQFCHARGLLGVALPGGTDAPWPQPVALDRNPLPRGPRSGGDGGA
jgi:hypothetical protein